MKTKENNGRVNVDLTKTEAAKLWGFLHDAEIILGGNPEQKFDRSFICKLIEDLPR